MRKDNRGSGGSVRADSFGRAAVTRDAATYDPRLQPDKDPAAFVFDAGSLAILDANKAAAANYGYTRDELLELNVLDLHPPDDQPSLLAYLSDTAHLPRATGKQVRQRKKDGSLIEVEISLSSLKFGERPARYMVAKDITEQVRLSRELRRRDEDFLLAMDAAGLGICWWNPGTGETHWDERSARFFGFPPGHAPHFRKLIRRIHPDDRRQVLAAIRLCRRTGEDVVEDYRVRLPDGNARWLSTRGRAVSDEDSRVERLVGVTSDITSRMQTEHAVRENEAYLRQLVAFLPGLVWTTTAEGSVDFVSPQWISYTGIAFEASLGDGWADAVHPDDREDAFAGWKGAACGRRNWDLRYRLRRHDGRYRWFASRATPICSPSGRVIRWFGICTDIDDLMRTEEALEDALHEAKQGRHFLDTLMEHVPDAVLIADAPDLSLRAASRYARETLGDLAGRALAEWKVFKPDGVTELPFDELPMVRAVRNAEVVRDQELVQVDAEGRRLWLSCNAVPIRDGAGNVGAVVAAYRDVTKRKLAEEEAARQRMRLEAILDNLSEGVIVFDLHGKVLDMNGTALKIGGYASVEEALGKLPDSMHRFELRSPAGRPLALEEWPISHVLRRETLRDFHVEILNKHKGQSIFVSYSGGIVSNAAGAPILGVLTVTDITERKRSEKALQESENRFRLLFANMTEGFATGEPIYGEDGEPRQFRLLEANEAFLGQTGLGPEIVGQPILDVMPQLEQSWIDTCCRVALTGSPARLETYNRDTNRYYDLACYSPMQGRFAMVLRDVTGRKQAEAERERLVAQLHESVREANCSRSQLEAVFQAMRDPVLVLDTHGRVILLNEAQAEILGYGSAEEPRRDLNYFVSAYELTDGEGRSVPFEQRPVSRVMRGESVVDWELKTRHKETGREWYFSFSAEPVRNEQGEQVLAVVVTRDITRRKRAEEALRDAETRLRLASEATRFGIFDYYPETGELIWSEQVKRHFGLQSDRQIDYALFLKALHPDDRERVEEAIREALRPESGGRFRIEYRTIGLEDGQLRWLEVHARIFFNEKGDAVRCVGGTLNITDRKWAEEELSRTKEEYRFLVEHQTDLVARLTPDGRRLYVNRNFAKMVGKTQAQIVDSNYAPELHPDDVERVAIEWQKTFEPPDYRSDITSRTLTVEGWRWLSWRNTAVLDAEGKPSTAICVGRDVTELKQAEEALHRALSEAEEAGRVLKAMMEHIPMGIAIVDGANGRIRAVSRFGRELIGHERKEIEGIPLALYAERWQMLSPDSLMPATGLELPLARAMEHGEIVREEEWALRRTDASVIPILCTAAPILDREGAVVGAVIGWQDISRRKRAEEALREADRRKDEFIATLAHELRNPLAPLRAGVDLIRFAANNPIRIEQARGLMERQIQHMVRLIDDLLDVSRITTGKLQLRKQPIELGAVMRAAVESTANFIASFEHRIDASYPEPEIYVEGDFARLTQVFTNLLTNAAKYTPRGGYLSLSAEREGRTGVARVRDSGIGIPQDKLEVIFEMFSQLHLPGSSTDSGLGIGLHLTQRLVEMHGGTIEAHSAGSHRGSEFVVRLPLVEVPVTNRPGPTRAVTGRQLRVLVIDDNIDVTESLAVLLELMGHDVRTANDGRTGLQAGAQFRPEAVLLDLGMPTMDGYQTAREIRASPWGRNVFISALSGWGQDEDRRKTREAGFDHHLLKPVEAAELQALFDSLAGQTLSPGPT